MIIGLIFLSVFVALGSAACGNGGFEYQSNCYYFNADTAGFGVAEVYCNSQGGHLAAIHDAFTNVVLGQEAQNRFNQSTVPDIWIGSSNLILNGKWNWTDGSFFDYNNWKQGEPKNTPGFNCAALTMKDGLWAAQDCYQLKPYVCSVPAPAYPLEYNCTDGWMYYPPTGSCYQMRDFNGTWFEAEQYCQAVAGAHQASIHSYAEFQFLYSFTVTTSDNLMLGIFTNDNYQTWETSDGTPTDFLNYNRWCGTKYSVEATTDKAAKIYAAIGYAGRPCYFTRNAGMPQYHVLCKKTII